MINYIEEGRTNLQEQEEMKRSSRQIFTGLIDVLRATGTSIYLFRFPLIRKGLGLMVDTTVSGDQQKTSIRIWSREQDLEKTRKIFMTIEGAGNFRVDRKTTGIHENSVVYKEGAKNVSDVWQGLSSNDSEWHPLNIDDVRRFQDTVEQIKAELSLHSGNH